MATVVGNGLGDLRSNPGRGSQYFTYKIWKTLMNDIWKHLTAISTLLGLISSVSRDNHHWISNQ